MNLNSFRFFSHVQHFVKSGRILEIYLVNIFNMLCMYFIIHDTGKDAYSRIKIIIISVFCNTVI